jgi:hypothetical protein
MPRNLVLASLALIALVAIGFLFSRDGADVAALSAGGGADAGLPLQAVVSDALPTGDPLRGSAQQAPETEPGRVAVTPEAEPSEEAAAATGARIHGRFVLPGGAPAVGVAVTLGGWAGNDRLVREYGLPKDWKDLSTISDQEGRFELRFEPHRAFQFTMEGRLSGHAAVSWRWRSIAVAEDKDVGTVELAAASTIVVRVVDSIGNTLSEDWRVQADSAPGIHDDGRRSTRVTAAVDPSTGVAHLEGVAPGSTKLKGYSRITGWVEGPVIEVIAGRELEAEIRYEGPDGSRRITVMTSTRPFHTLKVDEASVWLEGAGEPRRSK